LLKFGKPRICKPRVLNRMASATRQPNRFR
jgi:hypothetical protein